MVERAESERDGDKSAMNIITSAMSSGGKESIQRDESRSVLTRSNIGANSMQKLTGAASRAQLIPQADLQNEIQVSVVGGGSVPEIHLEARPGWRCSAMFRTF